MIYTAPKQLLLLLLLLPSGLYASPPDYSNASFRIGYGYGRYTYHQSGPEIYMWRINHQYGDGSERILEVSDKFSQMQDFNGFSALMESAAGSSDIGSLRLELGFHVRRKTSDARYTYDNGDNTPVVERYEKVKISTNMVFMTLGYRPVVVQRLMIGLGMDIGMLRMKKKLKDPNIAGEDWYPWFYRPKIFGSGFTGKTPIAAYSIILSYDISVFTIRITHTRHVLDGQMDSQTYKYTNLPWSSKVIPIGNTMVSLYYNFNH